MINFEVYKEMYIEIFFGELFIKWICQFENLGKQFQVGLPIYLAINFQT